MLKLLENAFAAFDAENAAKSLAWANDRVEALKAFKASDEYKELSRDAWKLYPRMFNLCGGKSWYQIFNYERGEQLAATMAKNSKAIADKRNATIVAKLTKIGVTEADLGNLTYSRTNDGGYNGVFSFQGAAVEIRTIVAGGYNVQCLHQRTLVYVNDKRI